MSVGTEGEAWAWARSVCRERARQQRSCRRRPVAAAVLTRARAERVAASTWAGCVVSVSGVASVIVAAVLGASVSLAARLKRMETVFTPLCGCSSSSSSARSELHMKLYSTTCQGAS